MNQTQPQPTANTNPGRTRYVVKDGSAQGAEVIYRPRSDEDGFPWEVQCRWHPQFNGWRYAAKAVTTFERYRLAHQVARGHADPTR
jgi:hypothetical protein